MADPLAKVRSILSPNDEEDTDQNASATYEVSPGRVRSEVALMIEGGDISKEEVELSPDDDLLEYVEDLASDLEDVIPEIEEYPTVWNGYHEDVTNLEEQQKEWIQENATAEMIETVDEAKSTINELLLRSQDLYHRDIVDISNEDLDSDELESKYPELYNLWVVVPATISKRVK